MNEKLQREPPHRQRRHEGALEDDHNEDQDQDQHQARGDAAVDALAGEQRPGYNASLKRQQAPGGGGQRRGHGDRGRQERGKGSEAEGGSGSMESLKDFLQRSTAVGKSRLLHLSARSDATVCKLSMMIVSMIGHDREIGHVAS